MCAAMTGTSISSGTYLVCNYGPALVRERGVKGLEGGVVKGLRLVREPVLVSARGLKG